LVVSHLDYLDGRLRLDFASNATEQDIKTSPKRNKTYNFNSDSLTDATLSLTNEKIMHISTDIDSNIDSNTDSNLHVLKLLKKHL